MSLGEADTRAKLIDPGLHARGWTEDLIRREETAGAVEIVGDLPRRRPRGRVDDTLRVKVNAQSQPVAVALIEAKAEHLPPAHGLEQVKAYAACRRLNVLFAFSSNGHQFVEFDCHSGITSAPRPLAQFPTPDAQWSVRAQQRKLNPSEFTCLRQANQRTLQPKPSKRVGRPAISSSLTLTRSTRIETSVSASLFRMLKCDPTL
jgi:type I site-specific restriction endonuclease